jgi:hypothetical protein
MPRRITIDQAPGWARELEGKLHQAALRGVQSAGLRLVSRIHEVIDAEPKRPVDRGIYRGAWRATPDEHGTLVHNDSPHGGFVEDGVRAQNVKIGRKMIDALVGWVERKGLVRDERAEDRTAASRSIAFAIAKSMQERGIFGGTGLKILEKARRSVGRFLEEEISVEIRKLRGRV